MYLYGPIKYNYMVLMAAYIYCKGSFTQHVTFISLHDFPVLDGIVVGMDHLMNAIQ